MYKSATYQYTQTEIQVCWGEVKNSPMHNISTNIEFPLFDFTYANFTDANSNSPRFSRPPKKPAKSLLHNTYGLQTYYYVFLTLKNVLLLQLKKEKKELKNHFILPTNRNIYFSFHFKWQFAKDELSKIWLTLVLSVLAMTSKTAEG